MTTVEDDDDSPFWSKLFGAVNTVAGAIDLALQASNPDSNEKGVSAITKKKLAQRSLQGLSHSKAIIFDISKDLRGLQRATMEYRHNMDFASKSQRELMEQAEAMSMDLQTTLDQLRQTEAARLSASRESQALIVKLTEMETRKLEMEASLKESQQHVERSRREVNSCKDRMQQMEAECERVRQAAADRQQEAEHATAALGAARSEANRATLMSQRHQEVVAQLTGDNLVLLMQLKKAEAELESTQVERAQLRLAVEKQRGPWFAEVRAGVESKVKQAMAHAEELERQMDLLKEQHASSFEVMAQEKAELESFLEASRTEEVRLGHCLDEARAAETSAHEEARRQSEIAAQQRERATALAAEVRALLDSARSMREECNERWMSEQAATKSVQELEAQLSSCMAELTRLRSELQSTRAALDAQSAVNKQLMARKEEVEWQLMSALAQVGGGEPLPMNVTVSGRMQVDAATTFAQRSASDTTQTPQPHTQPPHSGQHQQHPAHPNSHPTSPPHPHSTNTRPDLEEPHTQPSSTSAPPTQWDRHQPEHSYNSQQHPATDTTRPADQQPTDTHSSHPAPSSKPLAPPTEIPTGTTQRLDPRHPTHPSQQPQPHPPSNQYNPFPTASHDDDVQHTVLAVQHSTASMRGSYPGSPTRHQAAHNSVSTITPQAPRPISAPPCPTQHTATPYDSFPDQRAEATTSMGGSTGGPGPQVYQPPMSTSSMMPHDEATRRSTEGASRHVDGRAQPSEQQELIGGMLDRYHPLPPSRPDRVDTEAGSMEAPVSPWRSPITAPTQVAAQHDQLSPRSRHEFNVEDDHEFLPRRRSAVDVFVTAAPTSS